MKKLLSSILISLCLIFSFPITCFALPKVSAKSAIVMIADTGEVIYGKNENAKNSIASTTKIMTSLLAIESGKANEEITVKDEMIRVEGTSMGLLNGDKVTIKALTYGMLLQSGNDAANVTAYALAGNIDKFLVQMNTRAKELGMNNTSFATPSGLDAKEHYSTAYDMALLGSAAIKNPEFVDICSQTQAKVCYGNPPYTRTLKNHNRLLKLYDDAIGIKTGFTKKSGRCLVSAAERDGVTLVVVTLNAPNDWADHTAMLDYGFSQVKKIMLTDDVSHLSLNVVGSNVNVVPVETASIPYIVLSNAKSYSEIRVEYYKKAFEYAPLKKGDIVGEIRYFIGDKQVAEVDIVTSQAVEAKPLEPIDNKKSLFDKIKNLFR